MSPFRRILVYAAVDDDELLGLAQAAALARSNHASITVVRVLADIGVLARWQSGVGDAEALRRIVAESQQTTLEERVAPLREEGLGVRIEIRWGTPWLELIRCVRSGGYDLVVKTAEGISSESSLFFGSTAMHLIRKCPCPVWVVGSEIGSGRGRVLAAIDPTEDETRSAIADRVLASADEMTEEGGELHVASAWTAPGEHLLASRISVEDLSSHVRAAEQDARAALHRVLSRTGDPVKLEHVHLLKGHARMVLAPFIERSGFDLVVMGSFGRVGIAGFLIGETAETLVRSVRCSVLVLKPPGFVCPVG